MLPSPDDTSRTARLRRQIEVAMATATIVDSRPPIYDVNAALRHPNGDIYSFSGELICRDEDRVRKREPSPETEGPEILGPFWDVNVVYQARLRGPIKDQDRDFGAHLIRADDDLGQRAVCRARRLAYFLYSVGPWPDRPNPDWKKIIRTGNVEWLVTWDGVSRLGSAPA